jgi:hypothetical protein
VWWQKVIGNSVCDGKTSLANMYKLRDSHAAKLGITLKCKGNQIAKRPAAHKASEAVSSPTDSPSKDDEDEVPLVKLKPSPKKKAKRVATTPSPVHRRPAAAPSIASVKSDEGDLEDTESEAGLGFADPPEMDCFDEAQLLV